MKQIIGKVLFFLAFVRIMGLFFLPQPRDTTEHRVQDFAFVFFILVIGIAMSRPPKTSDDEEE